MYFTTIKIIYLVVTLLATISKGIEQSNLFLKHYSNDSKKAIISYDKNFHTFQTVSLVLFMILGAVIWLDSKSIWYLIISDVFLSAALYWALFDGTMNTYRGKKWFFLSDYQKKYKTSFMSYIDKWYIKIIALIAAIILNLVLFGNF